MKAFATYTPELVPTVFSYDSQNSLILSEYLYHYRPIQLLFERGDIPADVSRYIATLMGRNHGRTHRSAVSPAKKQRYMDAFHNENHFNLWRSHLGGLLDDLSTLTPSTTDSSLHQIHAAIEYNKTPMDILKQLNSDRNQLFTRSITALQQIFLTKKETLIHGELDSTNILFRQKEDDSDPREGAASLLLKAVDFENCRYGPAGLDLGLFLSCFMSYYVAHALPAPRRNLLSQVAAAIDAYKVAFRIQFSSTWKKDSARTTVTLASSTVIVPEAEVELNEILIDAVGFAALYLLLVALELPLSKPQPLDGVAVCDWGDRLGRQRSVHRRMVHLAGQLFDLFQQHHDCNDKNLLSDVEQQGYVAVMSVEKILNAVRTDDTLLLTDHYTEFWS
mmetsp:Transcript_19341/g.26446  ORF Transcript_19341/g.26446 Transcript_19341/m.26446 type:complete len:391 (-) Transcript_19341:94-1266(-)